MADYLLKGAGQPSCLVPEILGSAGVESCWFCNHWEACPLRRNEALRGNCFLSLDHPWEAISTNRCNTRETARPIASWIALLTEKLPSSRSPPEREVVQEEAILSNTVRFAEQIFICRTSSTRTTHVYCCCRVWTK